MNIFEDVNKKLKAVLEGADYEEDDYMSLQHNKELSMDIEDLGEVDTDAGHTYLVDNCFEFILLNDLELNEERIKGWLELQFKEELEEGAFSDIIVKDLEIKDGKGTFKIIFKDDKNESLNEGDVVSFADFKAEKEAEKAIEGAADEVVKAKINFVKSVNYKLDDLDIFEASESYDFKYFQTIIYALDQLMLMKDSSDAIKYIADVTLIDGEEEQTVKHDENVIIGSGKAEANMLTQLETYFDNAIGKAVIFDGDIVPSESDVQKKLMEIQKKLKDNKIAGLEPAEAKDYSNGGTKFGQDVEEGDILYYSFNYGHTTHYFLKVIEKKGASIKLAELEKIVDLKSDDDGRVVPSTTIKENKDLEGRWFRIHKSKADWDDVVCKFNDRNCYYWNGQPKHETYMD